MVLSLKCFSFFFLLRGISTKLINAMKTEGQADALCRPLQVKGMCGDHVQQSDRPVALELV